MAGDQGLPFGAEALGVLGMGPHDDAVAMLEQHLDHLVDARVEDVPGIPRRGDEHHRGRVDALVLALLIGGDLLVDEVVPDERQPLGRRSVELLHLGELGSLMGADAEHLVEVVVAVLRAGKMEARRVMGHVHVVDVLAHVRALDVGVVELWRAHGHHVGVHLHHEGDEATLADVVRQEARLVLGDSEDLVIRVVRDVVDLDIRVGEQPLDGALEVLVEAASLRVEHKMLALDGEEALVVGALPPRMGIALVPLPLGSGRRFELLERVAGSVEHWVIDVFGGLDDGVAGELDGDGHEVRADPVERHAAGHERSEAQRERDRDAVGRRLLGAGLLVLERVDAVGRQALHER